MENHTVFLKTQIGRKTHAYGAATMGFSFRGKTSEQPILVSETDQGISSATNPPAADLKKFKKLHQFDPFLDLDKLDRVDDALATGDAEKEAAVEEQLIIDDSPYPEVRSSVRVAPRDAIITHQATR